MPEEESKPMGIIDTAVEFIQKLNQYPEVLIRFMKKNGQIRLLRGTLQMDKIPRKKRPKKLDLSSILKRINEFGLIRVFDLEKDDWRSVSFLKTDYLETPEGVYKVQPRKGL